MKTNSHTCFDVIILYLISSSSFPSTNPSYPPSRSIYGASTSHSIHSPLCSPPVSPFRSRYSSSFLYSTSLPSNQGQLPSILAQVVPPASGLFVLFMRLFILSIPHTFCTLFTWCSLRSPPWWWWPKCSAPLCRTARRTGWDRIDQPVPLPMFSWRCRWLCPHWEWRTRWWRRMKHLRISCTSRTWWTRDRRTQWRMAWHPARTWTNSQTNWTVWLWEGWLRHCIGGIGWWWSTRTSHWTLSSTTCRWISPVRSSPGHLGMRPVSPKVGRSALWHWWWTKSQKTSFSKRNPTPTNSSSSWFHWVCLPWADGSSGWGGTPYRSCTPWRFRTHSSTTIPGTKWTPSESWGGRLISLPLRTHCPQLCTPVSWWRVMPMHWRRIKNYTQLKPSNSNIHSGPPSCPPSNRWWCCWCGVLGSAPPGWRLSIPGDCLSEGGFFIVPSGRSKHLHGRWAVDYF